MSLRIIAFGDPHIQVSNLQDVDTFISSLQNILEKTKPDMIVCLGDVLHSHERLNTHALNKAVELFRMLRGFATTYVLVGNHDYIQNQQFLSDNHWMNVLHEWDDIVVVDKVIIKEMKGSQVTFCPYVPNGRFKDALSTCTGWEHSDVIFAHQEFLGCKMGGIVSETGDCWESDGPLVISGHIHEKQWIGKNIYYTGVPMQHSFGDSGNTSMALLSLKQNSDANIEEIPVGIAPKRNISCETLKEFECIDPKYVNRNLRLVFKGTPEEIKMIRHTNTYKSYLQSGVKVVFRSTRTRLVDPQVCNDKMDLRVVLNELINNEEPEIRSRMNSTLRKYCPQLALST
jgi:DNA repair exonuclease SbcCD nuclease subunit